MSAPKLYPYEGRMVRLAWLAEEAKCTEDAMYRRLRKFTPEEAVAMGTQGRGGCPIPTHAYKGEQLSITQLAKRAGCTRSAMQKRLRAGYTIEEAVAAGTKIEQLGIREYQGRRITVRELAEMAGCGTDSMHERLAKYSIDEAIAMGPDARTCHAPRYAVGDEMVTAAELARRAGCGPDVMRKRLKRMSAPEALAHGKRIAIRKAPKRKEPKPGALLVVPSKAPKKVGPKAPAEIIVPANVKRTVCPAFADARYKPERVESYFSALTPGNYPPSDSHMAKVYA